MKSYLGLIPRYEKLHYKNNRISVLCIILSVCLVMAIFSMADMAMRSQKNYFIKTNGEYNAKQTRPERRIGDYFEHVSETEQDMAVEVIIQCGQMQAII